MLCGGFCCFGGLWAMMWKGLAARFSLVATFGGTLPCLHLTGRSVQGFRVAGSLGRLLSPFLAADLDFFLILFVVSFCWGVGLWFP
ncbi:hypothetical protein MA16_Dca018092 [Dendrobium catenatum]|uniref:Uncharacterized protein n=1 Tax=Dendrobium catenatum TaxID=906689 RepID=A0A2I0XI27_9ASPA|nr:hypothetical protein MA16_Dca018092 [Dendrobium catenatum]